MSGAEGNGDDEKTAAPAGRASAPSGPWGRQGEVPPGPWS